MEGRGGGGVCLPTSEFCFMSLFDWPISKKFWRFPSTIVVTPNLETYKSQYWPTYVGFKRTMLGEHMGTKVTHYWEHVGEPIGNLMWTWWEHDENTLGTQKAQHLSTLPPQEKEIWLYWVHVASPHLLNRIYNPNCVHGLILLHKKVTYSYSPSLPPPHMDGQTIPWQN
jgi:hypothetical protein